MEVCQNLTSPTDKKVTQSLNLLRATMNRWQRPAQRRPLLIVNSVALHTHHGPSHDIRVARHLSHSLLLLAAVVLERIHPLDGRRPRRDQRRQQMRLGTAAIASRAPFSLTRRRAGQFDRAFRALGARLDSPRARVVTAAPVAPVAPGDDAESVRQDVVEHRLEVVQENGISRALEDEGEAPEGVDAGRGGGACGADAYVGEEERDGEEHAGEQDAEAPVDAHEGPQAEAVRLLDRLEQLPRREDPPRVPEQRFPGPDPDVGVRAEVVEVFEVGPAFDDPEGLHGEQGEDEEAGAPAGEEGSDFQP